MILFNKKLQEYGVSQKQLEDALQNEEKEAEKILEDETKVQKLIDMALKLCDKLSRLPVIGGVFEDLPLACMLISDYSHGNYRDVPLATIITLLAAIIYFFSPLNIIPNVIPVIGVLDDAVVWGLALQAARNDLQAYRIWKEMQSEY